MTKQKRIAGWLMVVIFGLTLIFHVLVLSGIIPYSVVWGGRLQSEADMHRFEAVSILINAFFLFIVLIKMRLIRLSIPSRLVSFVMWFMVGIFALNTIGNLFSVNAWERIIFTPVTLLLSAAAFILARKA